jgi:two-component system, NarL family, sensor histidine kinase DegS
MGQYLTARMLNVMRNPHFWAVAAMFAVAIVFQYPQQILGTDLPYLFPFLGLSRHAVERIFLLAPVIYASFFFGKRAGIASLVAACSIMFPWAILLSPYPRDALLESTIVVAVGAGATLLFNSFRKQRERCQQALSALEMTHGELRKSAQRCRELFEGAYDAIWVYDLKGNIQSANKSAARITGYPVEELLGMKIESFLSAESLQLALEVQDKLIGHQSAGISYEQKVIKKDGSQAICVIATSLISSDSEPKSFQSIARDVTEEKRMQENLRYYLQQITKAQEEERRRIARELHDDTAQQLVVLSRRVDNLLCNSERLSRQDVTSLEVIRQLTDEILDGVRRFCQDLRPSILDDLGLLPALQSLTSELSSHFGMPITMASAGPVRRLSPETELILFRIAQEGLRNVCRHSEASRAWIMVEFSDDRVVLTIKDNGKGFKSPDRVEDLAAVGKLGLAGMQERAHLVGGALTIESELSKGTTVSVEIPI